MKHIKNVLPVTLEEYRTAAEREALRSALRESGGDRSQTARILAVHRATVFRLLAEHSDIAEQFPEKPGREKKVT